MTKTRRRMAEQIKLVDAVIELLDARCPRSSRNPDLDELCGGKPRLVVLNRAAQADPNQNARWRARLSGQGQVAVETDCVTRQGLKEIPQAIRTVCAERLRRYAEKGQSGRGLRLMVAGVPNVGKSTFINALSGRRAAKAEDRPGVTRGSQWFAVGPGLELLDTPGILWPKFEDERTGLHLAYTGAVRDQILDAETLAGQLCDTLNALYPGRLAERYGLTPEQNALSGLELLTAVGRRRGFLRGGAEVDLERAAAIVLDEFRGGKLGRCTLDSLLDA
jgi:ribosome biogenesis GTPase A